jgi:hypothetical protein
MFTFLPMLYRSHLACKIYGGTSTYFNLISLFSTIVVADCMRKIFLRYSSQSQDTAVQVLKEYYFFVFLFPLTFVWLPATTNSFGINDHDLFCWIKIDSSDEVHNDIGFMWIIVTFYLPYVCGICFNTYVYANVFYWVSVWKVHFRSFFTSLTPTKAQQPFRSWAINVSGRANQVVSHYLSGLLHCSVDSQVCLSPSTTTHFAE